SRSPPRSAPCKNLASASRATKLGFMKTKYSWRFAFLNAFARHWFQPGGFLVSLAWLAASSTALAKAPALAVTVTPDTVFQAMFESYGNDNTLLDDWTGSDGALSVVLPDGRVV